MFPSDSTQLTDYQGSSFRRFTGKEKDSESGYYYFGARYFMPNLSIWNSVDPMADKYPSLSPYNYCAWNPMKLVDPNGEEVGDYYDVYGNYLGWDGKYDNCIYILWDRSDINMIKENDKEGETTSINDLKSAPLFKTTYGIIRESCDVLNRAERNSNQTKEESSVVDFYLGIGVRGKTGESQSTNLPVTPEWMFDAVSIHSHNKNNDATQMSNSKNDKAGDADNFGNYTQNVIVGPLGVGGEPGLCFYRRTSQKEAPIYSMSTSVANKIIRQQSIRQQRKMQNIIKNL